MKRNLYLFFFLMAVLFAPQAMAGTFPTISTSSKTVWYYLRFTKGDYVLTGSSVGQPCIASFAARREYQLWKVEGTSAQGYTLTNQLGQTLTYAGRSSGSELYCANAASNNSRFDIPTFQGELTLKPHGETGNLCVNVWGGMGLGNPIKFYSPGDANSVVAFVEEKNLNSTSATLPLIPYPASVVKSEGTLLVNTLKGIVATGDSLKMLAQTFADDLQRTSGIALPTLEQQPTTGAGQNSPAVTLAINSTLGQEAYRLTIKADGVKIEGGAYGGVFYALQTLRQLLPRSIYGKTLDNKSAWTLPYLTIQDAPQLGYRGFQLDVSRHFFTKEEVEKLLDAASVYKLNRFHWHLTDDQGWRIEIPEYPRLTTVGAVRNRSLTLNDPTKGVDFFDDTEYGRGCFYTLNDLREIVDYARARNIEIIPEIDMPGHMVAAVAAYPWLSCDSTKHYTVRAEKGISTDVLNVGDDRVIDFLKCVLGHVVDVFPSRYIHLGGDECPTTVWRTNKQCQDRIKNEGLSGVEELQPWLVETLGTWLKTEYGRDVVVWDELINHWKNSYTVKPVVMAYSSPERIKASVAKGFTSIFAPTFPLYFDILQVSPAQTEIDAPYIGGYGDGYVNSVDKVYNVNPMAMVSGKEKLLLGAQACLWTESCNNNAAAEYQLYPRLLALSEMSWLPQAKRRFTDFYLRLQTHAALLDTLKITYAKHFFETPRQTAAEKALTEADTLLAQSHPGAVGYPAQTDFNLLQAAANAFRADTANVANLAALTQQIANYKKADVKLPEAGKVYQLVSASTYYRKRFAGSTLYTVGDNLKIHYTPQTEPEELFLFQPQQRGGYVLRSVFNGKKLQLANVDAKAALNAKDSTVVFVRKAMTATAPYDYQAGVLNLRSNKGVLSVNVAGFATTGTDSALCYPGCWRIVEVTDFTAQLQGLVNKANRILSNSRPGEVGEPTAEALNFLRSSVVDPATADVAAGSVSRETFQRYTDLYEQYSKMKRTSVLDGLSSDYYYYIQNGYFTAQYAAGDAVAKEVKSKTLVENNDSYLWVIEKQANGSVRLRNKLTNTYAYVTSSAIDQGVKLGQAYSWELKLVTTDQGNEAIAIVVPNAQNGWYTNVNTWKNVLLKPYTWGASVWNFVRRGKTTGIETPTVQTEKENKTYDLQGRRVLNPTSGVYIINGEKVVK